MKNHQNELSDDERDYLRALIANRPVRDILEFMSEYMAEMEGAEGYQPDMETMRDDAAIVAHAAKHVKG
jgi:hypothetical protein